MQQEECLNSLILIRNEELLQYDSVNRGQRERVHWAYRRRRMSSEDVLISISIILKLIATSFRNKISQSNIRQRSWLGFCSDRVSPSIGVYKEPFRSETTTEVGFSWRDWGWVRWTVYCWNCININREGRRANIVFFIQNVTQQSHCIINKPK